MTCNSYSSIEAAKEAMEKLSTETKEYFERQTELINKAFTGDEQTTKTKPEIKAIVVHHFLKNDTIKDLEKDKKMKAKLILDDGREIEIELTEEQEKAINEARQSPKEGDKYYFITKGGLIELTYHKDRLLDEWMTSIGNYFKTEQEAENMIRALKLIENVRRDRKRLNGDWKPDWKSAFEKKWSIYFLEAINDFAVYENRQNRDSSIFGYYEFYDSAYQIINKYKSELTWFFNEFLPERD